MSNYYEPPVDPRADDWLGTDSASKKIRESGLWNVNHVDESPDPASLDRLAEVIGKIESP